MQRQSQTPRRVSKNPVAAILSLLILSTSIAPGTASSASAAVSADKATAESQNSEQAKNLFLAIISAYGGEAQVKAHHEKPLKFHGEISSSSSMSAAANTVQCTGLQMGNRMRVELKLLGAPLIIGFDGQKSWSSFSDWVAPNGRIATELITEANRFGLPVLSELLKPGSRLVLLPKQEVRGKLCDTLQATTPTGEQTTFFADPNTHQIIRCEYIGLDDETGEQALQTLEYDDYKAIAGSIEPMHTLQYTHGKKRMETRLQSIETDVRATDEDFRMPPVSEIARLKEGPVSVPFEYTNDRIIITVRVNHGQEQRFILDTGSSQSVIDKSTAAAVGNSSASTFSVTTGGTSLPMGYITIPNLSIGDITLNDMPVLIADLSTIAPGISGLIGTNILKRFAITFDFDNRILTFADPGKVEVPKGADVVPACPVFGGSQLLIRAVLNEKVPAKFLLDTGAAFNNLPKSVAKSVFTGALLPTQSVAGLDGQLLETGSIRLDSMKLGSATITAPVFHLVLNNQKTSAGAGLLNSESIGILGNAIWSRFRTTLDYRNERVILEAEPGHERFSKFMHDIEAADIAYLRTKDATSALKDFEKIKAAAESEHIKTAQALALGKMASCCCDRFSATKDNKWLDEATKYFEQAQKLAAEARNRQVEGQVLAQWGLMYFNAPRSQDDIAAGQALILRALKKAPLEPNILAAFGSMMLRQGKKPEAEKFINSALSVDPSNWQALWAKYKLCQDLGQRHEQEMIAAQLYYYYPGLPEVTAVAKDQPSNQTTKHSAKHGHH